MTSDARLIAARYARALFDLATEEKQQDAVKSDMLAFQAALANEAFQKVLLSPALSLQASEEMVSAVLSGIKASTLTKQFFALLVRHRRLAITSQAIEQYLELLAQSLGELKVQVTSAQALEDAEIKTLSQAIAKSTGKKVDIETQQNPALLGGLQVRIGSMLLDNSVAGKLARLKQKLSAA